MKSFTYEIKYDQDAGNPRDEFDNISTFYAVKNSRYMTGGKHDIEYSYRDDLDEEIKALRKSGTVVVEFSHNAGDQYAVVDVDALEKEYIAHGYSMRKAKYHARRCAQGEIDTWIAWANGDVFGFVVTDDEGNHVDSCWGFYGEDGRKEAESQAKSIIEYHETEELKQDQLILARLSFA